MKQSCALVVGLVGVLYSLVFSSSAFGQEDKRPNVPKYASAAVGREFIARHCASCHGETKPKGSIRLDALRGEWPAERESWENVRRVLLEKEMPPRKQTQPTDPEVQTVIKWIEGRLNEATVRTPPRRLNRFEFNNTLNDLLGIDEDFTPFLPEDIKVHGLDTDAKALAMTGQAMAEYLRVALLAVQYAMHNAPPAEAKTYRLVEEIEKAKFRTVRPDNLKMRKDDTAIFFREGSVVFRPRFMRPQYGDDSPTVLDMPLLKALDFPEGDAPDRFRLTLTAQSTAPAGRSAPYLIVRINGQLVGRIAVKPGVAPRPYSFVFRKSHLDRQLGSVTKSIVLELSCGYETPEFFADFQKEREAMYKVLKDTKPDAMTKSEIYRKLLDGFPTLSVSTATLEPASYPAAPNPLHGLNLAAVKTDEDRARIEALLGTFLKYAFRRPAEPSEVAPYLKMYDREKKQRGSSRKALETCLASILCSPHFMYAFVDDERSAHRDYDRAEKLAYFLWSSMPDRELFDLAAAGKLKDPKVVDVQVERMLAHSKASRFFDRFATQWLGTARLRGNHSSSHPDYAKNENEYLRRSLADEAPAFFAEVVRNNLSAQRFIDSSFVVVNERTAPLYGLTGIRGGEFRRVDLPTDSPRGGVMTLASVMAATDHGKFLPIYRGAWVRETMFNKRLPNPPSDVPPLNPMDPKFKGKSFQAQIKIHREEARCAVCHVKLEPLGNAFEILDTIGQVRDRSSGNVKISPADTAGDFPDGPAYRDLKEYKKIMLDTYTDDVVRALIAKLIHYGRGRPPAFEESALVDGIVESARRDDFRMRPLLKAIARSELFLK